MAKADFSGKVCVITGGASPAAEARAFGIDVSVVCPGNIATELMDRLAPVKADGAAMKAQVPVRVVPVEEAARRVLDGVARRKTAIAFPNGDGTAVQAKFRT